ncbi:MAG: hypothetical protein KatS3mg016_1071 [Fimbriimonadales bacterium]|nr:MAG: hypothetical protein KatS3mg016_1071 [Fimbriimonadales bacterium]
MSQLLIDLIDYYEQCLLQERRESLSILEARLEQSIIPLHGWSQESWQTLNTLPVVQQFVQAQRGHGAVSVVYAPYVWTTTRGTRHEPIVGIYGRPCRNPYQRTEIRFAQ